MPEQSSFGHLDVGKIATNLAGPNQVDFSFKSIFFFFFNLRGIWVVFTLVFCFISLTDGSTGTLCLIYIILLMIGVFISLAMAVYGLKKAYFLFFFFNIFFILLFYILHAKRS